MEVFKIGNVVTGDIWLNGIELTKTRTGSPMIRATAIAENGESTSVISWDGAVVGTLQAINEKSVVVSGKIKCDDYNGSLSCMLTEVSKVYDGDLVDMTKFMKSLDLKELLKRTIVNLKDLLSEKAYSLIVPFMNKHKMELAHAMASQYGGFHDGLVGGLLNHTNKMLDISRVVIANYDKILTSDEKDLINLGILFHDLGKVIELKNGAYSEKSIVTHTVLGIELLNEIKEEIVTAYGEIFFYELIAIISQHHGEWGERPKTVYSYIVHSIDLMESRLSGLEKSLEETEPSGVINKDGFKLKFNRYGLENK